MKKLSVEDACRMISFRYFGVFSLARILYCQRTNEPEENSMEIMNGIDKIIELIKPLERENFISKATPLIKETFKMDDIDSNTVAEFMWNCLFLKHGISKAVRKDENQNG